MFIMSNVFIVDQEEYEAILGIMTDYNIQCGIVFTTSEWLSNMVEIHFPKICLEDEFDTTMVESFIRYQIDNDYRDIGIIVLDDDVDDEYVEWMVKNLENYNIILIMTVSQQ